MQNWNSLIKYIKLKLGVPTNLIEFTDADIKEYLEENVVPHMSNYVGKQCWILIKQENIITDSNDPEYDSLLSGLKYRIPVPQNVEIIDVYTLYLGRTDITGGILSQGYILLDPRDAVMANSYSSMQESMRIAIDYEFIRPDILILPKELHEDIIIECRAVHQDLHSIPADFYHDIFKKKCLGEIMSLCAAQRSKYDNLSTQFGPLPINWDRLEAKAEQILQEVDSQLDAMPPEILVGWFD